MADPIAEALRDLEAAKARTLRDATLAADTMKKSLVEQLLPVLDNLDRSLAAASAAGESGALVEGVVMVRAQLEGVLRGYGVERLDAAHATFDPAVHEAISTLPVDRREADNTVVDQVAAGYRFQGSLLRPARVVVGKYAGPQPAPEPEPVREPAPPAPAVVAAPEPAPQPPPPPAPAQHRPMPAPRFAQAYDLDDEDLAPFDHHELVRARAAEAARARQLEVQRARAAEHARLRAMEEARVRAIAEQEARARAAAAARRSPYWDPWGRLGVRNRY